MDLMQSIEMLSVFVTILVLDFKGDFSDVPYRLGRDLWDHYSATDGFRLSCALPDGCKNFLSWINQWISPMKERNGGIFVATSSLQSSRGMPGAAGYGASKSAISHCFESLHAKYHKDNIRFLVIYPGPVDTAMLKSDRPLPFTWKPEKAAKYIVRKVLKGSTKIRFPFIWAMLMRIIRVLPDKLYLRIFEMK